MFPAPPMPAFAPGHSASYAERPRYEDCTMDGRLIPLGIFAVTGGLWREVLQGHEGQRAALSKGVVPIMTRLTLVTRDAPIRVDRPLECHAGFELAHDRDAAGAIARLHMNVWADVRGTAGRLTPGAKSGELVAAGTVFAEHTFTRLMAPPEQRRVTSLPFEGYPEVPDARYAAPAATTAQEAPEGARWLDELAPDPAETCLSLDHTDANQHVNSLVYIRLFMDAAHRRLAAGGHKGATGKWRTRAADVAYRKPSFAGERVRAQLRLFEHAAGLGAAGLIAGDDGKPRCYIRVDLAN